MKPIEILGMIALVWVAVLSTTAVWVHLSETWATGMVFGWFGSLLLGGAMWANYIDEKDGFR